MLRFKSSQVKSARLKSSQTVKSPSAASYPSAAVNGHPTTAPSAVKKTAPGMLPMYQHPTAITVVFMANELGRNAVEEVNIPGAKTRAASVRRPVFTPNWRQIDLTVHGPATRSVTQQAGDMQ